MAVTDPKFNPSGDVVVGQIKEWGANLGQYIEDNVPAGRRRSIALTQLETALMWCVKAAIVGDKE